MPIRTRCPDCDAPVTAPSDAAGTFVECRKCGAEVRIPKSRARADRDDDDDDRPRSRSRRRDDRKDHYGKSGKNTGKKKRKARNVLVLGIVGAGVALLLLICGGIAIYRYATADPSKTKEIAGEKWYKPDEPNSMFTAFFPGDSPSYDRVGFKPPAFLVKKVGDPEDLAWSIQSWIRKTGGREYAVFLIKNPVGGQDADFAGRMTALTREGGHLRVQVLFDDQVTINGHQGRRLVTRGKGETRATMSFALGNRHVLVIYVNGTDNFDHTDPKVTVFFDNLTIH